MGDSSISRQYTNLTMLVFYNPSSQALQVVELKRLVKSESVFFGIKLQRGLPYVNTTLIVIFQQ